LRVEDVAHVALETVKDYAMAVQEEALNQAFYENQRLAHEVMLLRCRCESQALVPDYFMPGYWEDPAHTGTWATWDYTKKHRSPAGFHGSKLQAGYTKTRTSLMFDDSTEAGSSPRSTTDCSHAPSVDSSLQGDNTRTTVMMRNLPFECTREVLIALLQDHGYTAMFDLLYLPIDFKFNNGIGYAFVNFVSPEIAQTFCSAFTGLQVFPMGAERMCGVTGFKVFPMGGERMCEVGWSDVQGLETHVERYRNSPVMHDSVPDEYKPVLFVGSERVPFPKPTKKVRLPRHWKRT